MPESYSFVHFFAFLKAIGLATFFENFIFTAAGSNMKIISLATRELLVCPLSGSIFDPQKWTN